MYVDRRLAGIEEWYQGDPSENPDMWTPFASSVLESVCFICGRDANTKQYEVVGTGFFVLWENDGVQVYVVTARHVIQRAQDLPDNRKVNRGDGAAHIRVNTKSGSPREIRINGDWFKPHDLSVDLAAAAFGNDDDDGHNDFVATSQRHIATAETMAQSGIGVTDEVWIPGLFWPVQGGARMRPIVRSGVVAAEPKEPIEIEDASTHRKLRPFMGYLIEVRSIGGLSGSPVWVHLEETRKYGPGGSRRVHLARESPHKPIPIEFEFPDYLLGVVRLHWRDEEGSEEIGQRHHLMDLDVVNMGIAGVTPISELSKLLSREDVVAKRKAASRRGRQARVIEDAIPPDGTRGPEPERLKIDEPMDDAVKKMFEKGKPMDGEV